MYTFRPGDSDTVDLINYDTLMPYIVHVFYFV